MVRARIFVNDFPRQLIKATVSREGNRAIDQAKFIVCPETPICVTDQVVYIQDMVNLDRNNLIYNFCSHVKDESGYMHHPIGHTDFPSSLSHWDFQCVTTDIGKLQNTATERPLDMCMCCDPTPSVYTSGKVMCNNDVNDRAIVFACCRYLTISDECEYDLRQDQKWSMSTWVYPTTACDGMIMGKRAALACSAGYSLHRNSTCLSARFEIGMAAADFVVESAMCSVPLCMWTNITATYNGTSCRLGMKIYINGDLCSTGTASVIAGPVINCVDFSIGAESDGGSLFSGRVDGVYFFDKELTECEAAALFHEGGLDYVCGLWNGQAVVFDGCKGHLVVEDNAPSDPQSDSLQLQLKFECNIIDSSENNCCISMDAGCETYTTGLIDDNSFCFNGSRSIQVCCNNFNFDFCNEFSTSMWIKTSSCCFSVLSAKRAGVGCANTGYHTALTACGFVQLEFSNGTTEQRTDGTTAVNDGDWHHIVTTYDGTCDRSGMRIFVDGVSCTTGVASALTGNMTNCLVFTVGATGCMTSDFTGQIDCLRVWNKKLTVDEVLGLYEGTFGKFNTKYCIVTWVKAGMCCCDRTIFHKSNSNTTGVQLSIEQCATGGPGYTASGYTASGYTTAAITGGIATWRHNNVSISSDTRVDDSCWHQIRVRRNSCNLVTMYVDNVLQTTCITNTTDPTCTSNLEIARDFCCLEQFDGQLSSLRWYSGNLDCQETCELFNCRNPRSNVKFGGDITKSQKLISKDELVAHSFGTELGDTEVRAQQFCNRTPEFILQTLIKDNTDLDTHFHGISSGITLISYQADGKIVDIANDLSQLTGKVYHTDGLRQFHLHDASFTITTAEFNHFINMRNFETGKDDTEIVNCLLIIGENKRFTTSCTFTMCTTDPVDGCNTVFRLSQQPVTARVETPLCTEVCPDSCCGYAVNTATKTLTFNVAPMCGDSVLIEYEFELPLNIQGNNQDSIDDIGVKSKRLVLPWITTRQDGVRFINAYLENFKDVKFRTEAEIPGLANGINENDVVTIINDIKGLNGSFIIKSLTWEYPKGTTTMQLGEFNFQMLEFAKQITEKIHDLESAVVRIKDLRDYENPQETLIIDDTVQVFPAEEFTETVTITPVGESQLMEPA